MCIPSLGAEAKASSAQSPKIYNVFFMRCVDALLGAFLSRLSGATTVAVPQLSAPQLKDLSNSALSAIFSMTESPAVCIVTVAVRYACEHCAGEATGDGVPSGDGWLCTI
jgi:hypothetical protein